MLSRYALRAGALTPTQHKARRGRPPGLSDAVSANTLFWKILVTRVNSFLPTRIFAPKFQVDPIPWHRAGALRPPPFAARSEHDRRLSQIDFGVHENKRCGKRHQQRRADAQEQIDGGRGCLA